MNFLKKTGLLLMVLLLAVSLTACSSPETDEQSAEGSNDGTTEKTLVVGTDTSFVPFEFLNPETGEYDGFDIDLWAAIAEELGLKYEIKPMDFNGLIPALQAKSIDLALAGMTIKEERKEKVDFAVPYYDAGLLVLVREDNSEINGVDDLEGKIVATKTGTTSYDYSVTVEGVKEVKPFPNIDGAYLELLSGSADAVIFDSPSVLYYFANAGKGKVKPVGDLLEGQQYGIAFPKGSSLVEDVNQVMETFFENGKYDEIYEKWFGQKPKSRPAAS